MYTLTSEKGTPMRGYVRLRHLWRALRYLESLAALLALSWSSARLPSAARASAELLRSAASLLLAPGFVFLLGNAIVLVLLAKYRHPSTTTTTSPTRDLCDELLGDSRPPAAPEMAVAFEDKEVVSTERAIRRTRSAGVGNKRRVAKAELRRAESTVSAAEVRLAETAVALKEEKDAEAFQRTIEEFIEKQQRFQREEETVAVVCSAGGGGNGGGGEGMVVKYILR